MAGEPEKIGDSILKSLSKMGFSERLRKQEAVASWPEIAGSILAEQTEALRIDRDTLVVKVHEAAWRQQLIFLKDELLEKLRVKLGGELIKDIRFI